MRSWSATLLLLLSGFLCSCTVEHGRADPGENSSDTSLRSNTGPYNGEAPRRWETQQSLTSETLRRVFFCDEEYGWIVGSMGTILHTVDGGKNWKRQQSNTRIDLTDIRFLDRKRGFITGNSYDGSSSRSVILYSADGGSSWVEKTITPGDFSGVHFVDPANGWLFGSLSSPVSTEYVAEYGIVAHTEDGGASWNTNHIQGGPVDSDGPVYGVSFADPQTGWAIGSTVIRRTSDGGQTWKVQYKKKYDFRNLYGFQNIRFVNSQSGWVFGYSDGETGYFTGILHTTDGGETWQENRVMHPLYNIVFLTPNIGIGVGGAVPDDNSITRSPKRRDGIVMLTRDGGTNWELIDRVAGSPLSDIFVSQKGSAWAVGGHGIIRHHQSD